MGRLKAVKTPFKLIPNIEKATAFWDISTAFAVPIPWDIKPRVKPWTISLSILNSLKMRGQSSAPKTPVIKIKVTARAEIAPIWSEVIIAIGAEIDFVDMESIVDSEESSRYSINSDTAIVKRLPTIKVIIIWGKKDFIVFKL